MGMRERILGLKLRPDQLGIFFLGQMGFIIKYRDTYVMIDGYLTDYVDTHFSTPTLKWRRNYPAPITPDDLDFLDYVFCTHPHADHADPDTLAAAARCSNARFYVPDPMVMELTGYGVPRARVTGLLTDRTFSLCEGIAVRAIPAAHEELHKLGEDCYAEVGYVFSFVDATLYHSGDSCIYDGLEQRLADVDVVMLPVNGRDHYRRYRDDIIGCFNACEAVTLARDIGARLMIPAHFGLYDVNTVNPAELIDILHRESPAQHFHIFAPGEAYIYDPMLYTTR